MSRGTLQKSRKVPSPVTGTISISLISTSMAALMSAARIMRNAGIARFASGRRAHRLAVDGAWLGRRARRSMTPRMSSSRMRGRKEEAQPRLVLRHADLDDRRHVIAVGSSDAARPPRSQGCRRRGSAQRRGRWPGRCRARPHARARRRVRHYGAAARSARSLSASPASAVCAAAAITGESPTLKTKPGSV